MWPVIIRELRAESRRPFTYWLRVIGAAAILATVLLTVQQPLQGKGAQARYERQGQPVQEGLVVHGSATRRRGGT